MNSLKLTHTNRSTSSASVGTVTKFSSYGNTRSTSRGARDSAKVTGAFGKMMQ